MTATKAFPSRNTSMDSKVETERTSSSEAPFEGGETLLVFLSSPRRRGVVLVWDGLVTDFILEV